jgi:hypothetical protein
MKRVCGSALLLGIAVGAYSFDDKPRPVSRESVEYLKNMRKNAPFGAKGFDLPRNQTSGLALRLGILGDFCLGELALPPTPRQRFIAFNGETVRALSSGQPTGAGVGHGATGTSW